MNINKENIIKIIKQELEQKEHFVLNKKEQITKLRKETKEEKEHFVISLNKILENSYIIKPLLVGICRTDINVAFNKYEYNEFKKDIIIGHEMVGVLIDGIDNNKIVIINPSFPNNDFIGLNLDGCLKQSFFSIDKKQVYFTNKKLEDYPAEEEKLQALKEFAYLEPISAARSVILKLNKLKKNILLIGKNRISELVKIIIENDFKDKELNLLNLTKQEILKNNFNIKDIEVIIETELDQELFDFLLKEVKNNTTFLLKSRSFQKLNFKINDLVIKEIDFISAKYNAFSEDLMWLMKNKKLYHHLLGNVYSIYEWEQAFKEAMNDNNQQKIFIKI